MSHAPAGQGQPAATVVVFKLVRDPLQHGGLGVARSLGRLGVPVIMALRDRGTPAGRSRYVTRRVVLPPAEPDAEPTLGALEALRHSIAGEAILLPSDDVATLFLEAHQQRLRRSFLFPVRPAGIAERLSNKRELHQLCVDTGIATPAALFPTSRTQMADMAAELGFPVVVKAADPRLLRARPGARSVTIVATRQEALAVYEASEVPEAPNLMLQQHIPGDADSIWMFNGYFDAESRCLFGVTGQKVRQAPPRTGATTLGICRHNPVVAELATRLMSSVGYTGIVDMGFRFDARDGSYRLLDVNPRIGSSFRLFVGRTGTDVARAMYLDLTGRPVPDDAATDGRRWLVENQDLGTAWHLMRSGELRLSSWLSSLVGVDEFAWFAADDLVPALEMTTQTAADLGRRALRAAGERLLGHAAQEAGEPSSKRPMSGAAPTSLSPGSGVPRSMAGDPEASR